MFLLEGVQEQVSLGKFNIPKDAVRIFLFCFEKHLSRIAFLTISFNTELCKSDLTVGPNVCLSETDGCSGC